MTTPIQSEPNKDGVLTDPKTPVTVTDLGTIIVSVASALSIPFGNSAQQLVNAAEQRILTAMNVKHDESKALIKNADITAKEGIAANAQTIQTIVDSFGGTIAATLKANPRVTCALIIGSVATVWVGCLAVLIAYLVGAPDAKGVIGWAGAAFAATTGGAGILHQLGFLGTTATAPVPVPIVAPAAALATPVVVPVPEGGNT